MKKFILALTALVTMTVTASAMSYEQAREQALFLTDKMAYELNLTDDQYEAAYEINLDYLMSVNDYNDLYSVYWERRNLDLGYILFDWQYRLYCAANYFYRPLYWGNGYWHFRIYSIYPHRDWFYFGRPDFYLHYRGGHGWRMNGGHSWYHGRSFGRGFEHGGGGMRDGWNRGDYNRGGRHYNEQRFANSGRDGQGRMNGGNGMTSRTNSQDVRNNNGMNGGNNRQSFGSSRRSDMSSRSSAGTNNNSRIGRESSTRTTVNRNSGSVSRQNDSRVSGRSSSFGSNSQRSSSQRSNVSRGTVNRGSSSMSSRSVQNDRSSMRSSSRSSSFGASRNSAPSVSRSSSAGMSRSSSAPTRSSSSSMSRGSSSHSSSSHSSGGSRGGGGSHGGGFGGHR